MNNTERAKLEMRWIPVTERLPEDRDRVLISTDFFGNETQYVEIAGFAISGESVDEYDLSGKTNIFFNLDDESGYYEETHVTHWMPLPEPPKKGE